MAGPVELLVVDGVQVFDERGASGLGGEPDEGAGVAELRGGLSIHNNDKSIVLPGVQLDQLHPVKHLLRIVPLLILENLHMLQREHLVVDDGEVLDLVGRGAPPDLLLLHLRERSLAVTSHQLDHLLPRDEPGASEREVHRVDEAVIDIMELAGGEEGVGILNDVEVLLLFW